MTYIPQHYCEYSGDLVGLPLINGYMIDNVQVAPQYKSLFRGAKAKLIFIKPKYFGMALDKYGKPLTSSACWEYRLQISNPELQGQVGGKYTNYTYSKNAKKVLRKIRRLTRDYQLKIKWMRSTDKGIWYTTKEFKKQLRG